MASHHNRSSVRIVPRLVDPVETLEARRMMAVGPVPAVPAAAAKWTFDQTTGTTVADATGNRHTATLGGGASFSAGNVGTNALSLNNSAAGVATASGAVVNTANSFTASVWVKLNSGSGYQTALSIAGTSVAGFYLGLRADTGTFAFTRLKSDAAGTPYVAAASVAPNLGQWYHLVGVNDTAAGTLSLYIDGRLVSSVAYTGGWQATGNTLIGHGFYGGQDVDYVNGAVDDAQLFASALTAAQVAALDQPAAWSFDDGTGTTAADVTGHGKTLTLGSGAAWAAGRIGSNALAVNGTAAGLASNATPAVNTAQSFSVSAWVNLASTGGFQTFASIDGANVSGFYLQLRGDTGKFAFTRLPADDAAAASVHADAAAAPTTGTWYNLLGVNDVAAGRLLLYVNGVLQSSVAYAGGWQATGATVVGGGKFNGGRVDAVNGTIDDVRFYNSPLTADDAATVGTAGGSILNVTPTGTGVTVSPDLFGAFMEDINYGGEGGIYNDEVRNGGFNDSSNALNAWSAVVGGGVNAALASDATTGPTSALTKSGKLTVAGGVSATSRAGIANAGFFGVGLTPSTTYTVRFYAKATAGFTGPITVGLESTAGVVYASAVVSRLTTSWAQYSVTLTTPATTPAGAANRLVFSTNSATANGATIWFGAAHLYPPSYKGIDNHLRVDLMEKLAALKPAVFRVPGGNYLEGNAYDTRFQWSKTIGPVDQRPGHFNSAWGYWSSDGMGLDEYLQMAEEIGSRPVLAVFAGYTLNGTSSTGQQLQNDVADAINEIHYVLDPVTTQWGALRAANGHAAPYDVKDVEIGNEDWFSSTYAARYTQFYNAIHAAFPQLKIIASHTDTGGLPYDVIDEHFYNNPAWFAANSHYYDKRSRNGAKVFVGEWAANEGSPTNNMNSALGDAAWLMGLMRNSDLVTMESYAPIWSNVNGSQWTPDLIGFDNTTSYGSPSYYAQLMLANNHGTQVVSSTTAGGGGLQTLVTRTGDTYYVSVVNTTGTAADMTINLSGVNLSAATGTKVQLAGNAATVTNSITDPTRVVPVTSTLGGIGADFTQTFAGYSVTVLTIQTGTPPTLVSAVSRKQHGTAGTFDLGLPLGTGVTPAVEPRVGGGSQLVFTFSEAIFPADGTLDASEFGLTNAAFASATISGGTLTLDLTDVVDQARLTVVLQGLRDAAGNALAGTNTLVVRNLFGDVNASAAVNAADITGIKAWNGRKASVASYLFDINASGSVNAIDILQAKLLSGDVVN